MTVIYYQQVVLSTFWFDNLGKNHLVLEKRLIHEMEKMRIKVFLP